MSTQIVPFGTSNAMVTREAAQNIAIPHDELRTLQDLLDALACMVPHAPPMLHTSAAHFSEFVGVPPEEIELVVLVERAEEFKRYLKDRRYQKNSIRTFLHFIRLLVRRAEEFGWRRPEVPDCWRGIISLAPDRGCRKIVREAIRLGRTPEQLTDRDLKAFCRSQHEQGECYARTDAWLKAFRRWVRRDGLTARFASMDSLKPRLLYGLREADWPESFKKEVDAVLRWKQDDFAPGRPRDGQLSAASADKLKRFVGLLAGYVVNVYGEGEVANISSLVTEEIVTAFTSWSINERHKSGLAFKGELSSLHAALRQYRKYKDLDLSWFPALLKSIPLAPGTEALDRKVTRMLPYSVLSQIPGKIRRTRQDAAARGPRELASVIQDELLMSWLLLLPWRQRNLRECRVGGDKPNLFKGPLKSTLVAKPRWVREIELEDPEACFWQFRFTEKETKMGNRVHAILPRQLSSLLEEYLAGHRTTLVNGTEALTLFVNQEGKELNSNTMGIRVRTLTMRFGGGKMSPHVFRDAFAYEWLTSHPDDYLTVSKLLWHTNIQTTLKIYGAQFNESSAVCRLDEWLEASAAKAGSNG